MNRRIFAFLLALVMVFQLVSPAIASADTPEASPAPTVTTDSDAPETQSDTPEPNDSDPAGTDGNTAPADNPSGQSENTTILGSAPDSNTELTSEASATTSSPVASVTVGETTTEYADLHEALNAALNTDGVTSATVELLNDISYDAEATWTPVIFNQGHTLVFEGNNKTITNLPGMLFHKTGSGGHHLIMSDVTFESPKAIVSDNYAAVIMGYADSVNELSFTNVHINKAIVQSNKYAGAFYGYGAGYNVQSDGPVFAHYTFRNCSVTNSTIKGGGSAGALIGHATGNAWTKVVISNTSVRNNTITGENAEKTGILIGTVGTGQTDQGKDGGVWIQASESGNTLTAGQYEIGRIGTSGGTCYFTEGGSYTVDPTKTSDPKTGTITAENGFDVINNNGTYTIGNIPKAAVTADAEGDVTAQIDAGYLSGATEESVTLNTEDSKISVTFNPAAVQALANEGALTLNVKDTTSASAAASSTNKTYEITFVKAGTETPVFADEIDGATATVTVPFSGSSDKYTRVYLVTDNGEELVATFEPGTVQNTVTFDVKHFSTYRITQDVPFPRADITIMNAAQIAEAMVDAQFPDYTDDEKAQLKEGTLTQVTYLLNNLGSIPGMNFSGFLHPTYESGAISLNDLSGHDINNAHTSTDKCFVFRAVDTDSDIMAKYGDWKCDFVASFDKDVKADSIVLVGYYENMLFALLLGRDYEGSETKQYLISETPFGKTYNDIVNTVGTFICTAVNLSPDNYGKTISVSLEMWPDGQRGGEDTYTVATETLTFDKNNIATIRLPGTDGKEVEYYSHAAGTHEDALIFANNNVDLTPAQEVYDGPHFAKRSITPALSQSDFSVNDQPDAFITETMVKSAVAAATGIDKASNLTATLSLSKNLDQNPNILNTTIPTGATVYEVHPVMTITDGTNEYKYKVPNSELADGAKFTVTIALPKANTKYTIKHIGTDGIQIGGDIVEETNQKGEVTITLSSFSYLLATENVSYVAQIGTGASAVKYETLEAAFAAAKDGETIELLANCAGNGIKAPEGKFGTNGLTVDFNGHTYTVDGETVGSTGTETNGFQLLKDNKITFKNGVITSTKAKILIQNYSDLTLKGMTLTLNNESYTSAYTLSNNNGDVVIDGTTINANPAGGYAFDVCRYSSYPSVHVEVKGESKINGDIEIFASGSDAKNGFGLKLTSGELNGDIVMDATAKAAMAAASDKVSIEKASDFTATAPADYKWNDEGKLVAKDYVAQIGETKYESLADAFDAVAENGTTIDLLDDIVLKDAYTEASKAGQEVTLNLNGHAISEGALDVYGELTIADDSAQSGSITGKKHGIWVNPNGKLNVTGGTITTAGVGLPVRVESAALNVSGGTITNTTGSGAVYADGTSTITVTDGIVTSTKDDTYGIQIEGSSTATISGGTVTGHDWGVSVFDDSALTVSGTAVIGTAAAEGYAITTNGNSGQDATINIQGGTITGGDLGVYAPSGKLNISGGAITGKTAVYVKAGTTTITGGTLNGNGAAAGYTFNGNGANPTGDALVVDNCAYPNGTPTVTISGGEFNSTKGKGIGSYYGNNVTSLASVKAESDSITVPETEMWVADVGGYKLVEAVVVTFDSNGGSAVAAQKIEKGTTATQPETPTNEKGIFIGWFDGENAFDFDTEITANKNLTAKWMTLSADSIELYPNNKGTVKVENAVAGYYYYWKFAGQAGSGGYNSTLAEGYPYGKAAGEGTATMTVYTDSTKTEAIGTLVCNVTVKDVAARVDSTEYTAAQFADAVNAAINGDKLLEVYTSSNRITLTVGQTLKVKVADNRGKGSVTVSAPAATAAGGFVINKTTEDDVTTYTCEATDVLVEFTPANGGEKTYSTSLDLGSKAGTFKLLGDIASNGRTNVTGTGIVLDLNGHTINFASGTTYPAIMLGTSIKKGELTIIDSSDAKTGRIYNTGDIAIWAAMNSSSVKIEGGEIEANVSAVYTSKGSTAVINGGTFKVTREDKGFLINCQDSNKGTITVNGGTFYGFNPENNAADGANTNYVTAQNKIVVEEPTAVYTVYDAVTVTFDANNDTTPTTVKIAKGSKVTKPETPTKEGAYVFDGWYNGETKFDFSNAVEANVELQAKWTEAAIEYTAANGKVTYYASMSSSFSSSGTYKLLKDVTCTTRMTPGIFASAVTLDLNGHTLTSTASDYAILLSRTGSESSRKVFNLVDSSENKGGKLVVNTNATSAIQAQGKYNDITIGEGVTVEGCVAILSSNQTLSVNGTINGGDDFAIATNGAQTSNATININSGAVLTSNNIAVYLPASGTTTIAGSVTGATAVYVKSGTLNITGGTLNGNGAAATYTYNGNGANATGDALVVDSCGYPGGEPTVTISGGTFTSANGKGIGSYYGNNVTSLASVKATSNSITVPETEMWVADGEGFKLVEAKVKMVVGEVTTWYNSLQAAFDAAPNGGTAEITMLADMTDQGVALYRTQDSAHPATDKNIVVDFDKHTYTVKNPLVGSTGTVSQAFHFEQGNTVTLKNGTLKSSDALMLVQNYSDLTLDGMTLTLNNPNYSQAYTLSNNNGNVVINDTTINANPAGGFAFDVCRYASYPSVSVVVTGDSVINGNVEVSASGNDAKEGFSLTLTSGTLNGSIVMDPTADAAFASNPGRIVKSDGFNQTAPEGYVWVANTPGTQKLGKAVAEVDDTAYATLKDAVAAAQSGDTIKLLADAALTETVSIEKNLKIDLNGHDITATNARALHVKSGEVEITGNGTISATKTGSSSFADSSSVIRVGDGEANSNKAMLTIDSGVTVSTDYCYGITVFGKNDTDSDKTTADIELVVNGKVKVTGTASAISGNGTSTLSATKMTIGANAEVTATQDYAIYHPGKGELVVNGKVEGLGGIEMKGGSAVINSGASVKATATTQTHTPYNNGASTSGYAIAAVNNPNYAGEPSVTIHTDNITGKALILADYTAKENAEVRATTNEIATDSDYQWVEDGNGYKLVKMEVTGELVTTYSLNLASEIGIRFYVQTTLKDSALPTADYTIIVTNGNGSPVEKKLSQMEVVNGFYKFELGRFHAKQMTESVVVEIKDKSGRTVFTGNYSIKSYCDTVIATSSNKKLVDLCRAVLEYGTYSQKYFNHNLNKLANEGYDPLALPGTISADYKGTNGSLAGVEQYSALRLADQVELIMYFKPVTSEENITVTAQNSEFTGWRSEVTILSSGYMKVRIYNIPSGRLNEKFDVKVVNNNEEATWSWSAMSFAYAAQDNANMGDVVKALANYYQYAKAYFN